MAELPELFAVVLPVSLRRLAQLLVEESKKTLNVHGLGEIGARAVLQEAAELALCGVCADHDNLDVPSPVVRLESAQDLPSRHVRELKVQEDHVGAVLPCKIQAE